MCPHISMHLIVRRRVRAVLHAYWVYFDPLPAHLSCAPALVQAFAFVATRLSLWMCGWACAPVRLSVRQNVYLHTKVRKKPCPACIFSHIFPLSLFAEPTPFKLLVSCKIKTLKFQRFQLYAQSPAFTPVFLVFAFSHYLALFTRDSLKNVHLVCLYTF